MKRGKRKEKLFLYNDSNLTSGTNEWRVNYNGEVYIPMFILDSLWTLMKYDSPSAVGELINDVKSVVNYDVRSENPRYMVYL